MTNHLCLPARDGAPHDQAVPPHPPVPLGPYALDLDVLEPGPLEPLQVLRLRGEQHPGVGEQAGEPEGGVDRADQAGQAPRLDDPADWARCEPRPRAFWGWIAQHIIWALRSLRHRLHATERGH